MNKKYYSPAGGIFFIFTLFGIFNLFIFYYAGLKSKSKKYIFIGHLYLILAIISILTTRHLIILTSFVSFFKIIGYFFGIIFAAVTFKAFYERLRLLDMIPPATFTEEKKNIYSMDNKALADFVRKYGYYSPESDNSRHTNNNPPHSSSAQEKEIPRNKSNNSGQKNNNINNLNSDVSYVTKETTTKTIIKNGVEHVIENTVVYKSETNTTSKKKKK